MSQARFHCATLLIIPTIGLSSLKKNQFFFYYNEKNSFEGTFLLKFFLSLPGIEPGPNAWKASILTTRPQTHILVGPTRESNSEPLAPKARIIPLDQQAI